MTVEAKKETRGFQTEVKHLLHLMIHSLYSNKEIFLRELISNASDAADKLRFMGLSNDALYEGDSELKIRINFDKDQKTITIIDNGVGMDRQEVQEHIGTIAKSGTKQFFESLTGDQAKDSELIGQFGVGFYSAFIVADKVTVKTRKAGLSAEEGVLWESAGEGEYTLESIEKPTRGTEITLHLKESEDEFLDGYRLRSIVRKFSDHISLPIVMDKVIPAEKDDEGNETAPSRIEEETVNSASALWTKARQDISDEDYNEFYKHVGHDFQDPLAHVHSKVEGTNEYTLLLYVPSRAPFDLWDRDAKHGVKLYIKKVFITDDAEQLMPRYLRFIRGVIDASSLPLNVSREILQQSKQISNIKSGAVKKVLGLLEGIAKNEPEKYEQFWTAFGNVIKEGPIEDFSNRERIAKLLRFSSTHTDSEKQDVSLEDYVSRMKEGQEKIYYVTADSFAAAKNSPHLEIFRKKGIEVLLLSDRIDEWLISSVSDFDGKHLQSVAKGDLDLGKLEDEEEKKEQETVNKDFESVLSQIKEALKDKVSEVRLSHRLTDSPACLVSDVYGMSLNMERIMKEAGQKMPGSKPIFELNPHHQLVTRLKEEQDDQRFDDLAHILFDQAVLSEGGQLEDPAAFVHKLNGLLQGLLK
ncbi:MAG: molecular chaperone HtpG [Methylicorpusculum sp.]|uniref:molecular chaperone HtpG n=1 Tax=Methylicorpusculum sp. TaxID=2713644 RepID=UPI0027176C33|nr:molecular chaperone HtpG [Methylicorpusculum sp.]MDO8845229.1 molecular chaperone HtpG [Methylicorpusculum sp.]MDO8937649.1 molecular chaperone HtpG [Methylicorpusculum sp.]MDP2179782.1 molecular chaperone HtpG [Methylicorpusculum sp.]MDP2201974.1 molecular chaperone HtpG [Methylicorpusculum sp.]MDP3528469.1 molecular chaperone HtpG [Methylicorpusculum sp.]